MATPSSRGNRPLRFIQVYINFLSWFLVFPYSIKYDKCMRVYKLHWNVYRAVLCGLASAILLLSHITFLYQIKTSISSSSNPLTYFHLAEMFSGFFFSITCLSLIWLKSNLLADILDFFQDPRCAYNDKSIPDINKKLLLLLLLTSSPVAAVLDFGTDYSDASYSFSQLSENYYTRGLSLVFMNPEQSAGHSHGPAYIIIVACQVIVKIVIHTTFSSLDWTVLTFAALLHYLVNIYAQVVRDPEASAVEIQQHYTSLKMASEKLNRWLGPLNFMFVFGSLPYFISKVYEIVQPTHIARLIHNSYNLVLLLAVLTFGAIIDKKARVTKEWLSDPKHYRQMTLHELEILLHEVQDCEIGIYGFGIFKYTSGLLGSITSLLVTFAIIMLQFKGTGEV